MFITSCLILVLSVCLLTYINVLFHFFYLFCMLPILSSLNNSLLSSPLSAAVSYFLFFPSLPLPRYLVCLLYLSSSSLLFFLPAISCSRSFFSLSFLFFSIFFVLLSLYSSVPISNKTLFLERKSIHLLACSVDS